MSEPASSEVIIHAALVGIVTIGGAILISRVMLLHHERKIKKMIIDQESFRN
jgi:hypothetical protein